MATAADHDEQDRAAAAARTAASAAADAEAASLDTTAVEERLRRVTPGPWRRHGCDVWADGDARVPLLVTPRERDSSAEGRAQADRDGDFVAYPYSVHIAIMIVAISY
jgi:hypothetical protein